MNDGKKEPVNISPDKGPVAIVVLNYNGASVLPALLESLDRQAYPSLRVFMVDNASADQSLDYLRAYKSKGEMELIANDSNLLFSGGNNVGIRKALDWGAKYVLLLNNDTIVPPRLVNQLVDFLQSHSNVGIVGPMIHFGDAKNIIWAAGGMVSTWWGIVKHRGIRAADNGQFSEPSKVDYVSGAALMARSEVFNKIGLLDPSFPMYYEDTDFCFRARKAGFEIWYVPTDPLIHLVSVAAGGQVSKFKIQRRFGSGLRFFARHAKWYQWPTIVLGQVYEAIRVGLMIAFGKINSDRYIYFPK
jgi:GT2 family glycosyltransferase